MFDVKDFQAATDVSRETLALFETYVNLLTYWNKSINLVQKDTVPEFWERHAYDSAQLFPYVPDTAKRFIDLGAGAGFPGLALAIFIRGRDGAHVDLVESNGKKCTFLRTAIRELGVPASVRQGRAESIPAEPYDVVSARAFAPLPKLLDYAAPFWGVNTQGLFLKGRTASGEINQAKQGYDFNAVSHPSVTDTEGALVVVTDLTAHASAQIQAG